MKIAPESYKKDSRQFGEFYSGMIAHLAGHGDMPDIDRIDNPEVYGFAYAMQLSAAKYQERQAEKVAERQPDAVDLLRQVDSFAPGLEKLDGDYSGIRVEMLSPGVPAVIMTPDAYEVVFGSGSQAVAVMGVREGGIPFMMMKEYGDETFNNAYASENTRHEVHHLIHRQVTADGNAPVAYPDDETVAVAFHRYRDELLATAASGVTLHGYTHIQSMSPEDRAALQEREPEACGFVEEKSGELYDLVEQTQSLIRTREGVRFEDYLYGIAAATDFEELSQNIKAMNRVAQMMPEKERSTSQEISGWEIMV